MRAIKRGVLGMRSAFIAFYRILSHFTFYRISSHFIAFYLKTPPNITRCLKTPPNITRCLKKCAVTKIRKNALIRGVRNKSMQHRCEIARTRLKRRFRDARDKKGVLGMRAIKRGVLCAHFIAFYRILSHFMHFI
jgi:hypothetical protein